MKCKKCGKKLKRKETFCTICGYYNGDVNSDQWDEDGEDLLQLEENMKKKTLELDLDEEDEEKSIFEFELDNNKKEDNSEDKDNYKDSQEINYDETEELLESYIGKEDYKIIKKWPFNIWAFLLNWLYFIYRKLYITGIIGLFISWIMIIRLKKKVIIPFLIIMIIIGFIFNKYYTIIAKMKIEKITTRMDESDRYTSASICKEKGGVNLMAALGAYTIFIIAIIFSFITIHPNKKENTNFWEENSENKANCNLLIKESYAHFQKENQMGKVTEATCKVIRDKETEYNIYLKIIANDKRYYKYYKTEDTKLFFKEDTYDLEELEKKKTTTNLTPQEETQLQEKKKLETAYQGIYMESQREDKLIDNNQNRNAKENFLFTQEEIIR